MTKEEIKEYLNRVDKLLDKLKGEDKETWSWLIYGYNQCAKLLNETQKENEKLKAEYGTKAQVERDLLKEENKQLKDKLSKIETLIINHNCDTGDIYYKYNSKFLKSELKQRILEIVYEQGSDSNGQWHTWRLLERC